MSVIGVVEDLIALQQLANQERDAARRRSLDAVREHVAERDRGAKVGEAAQVLGVSAPTVRAWIDAGALQAVAGSRPVRVGVMSLAVTKGVMDEVRTPSRRPGPACRCPEGVARSRGACWRGCHRWTGRRERGARPSARSSVFGGVAAREADLGIDVGLTRTAERQIRALRGRHAQAARQALEALLARGCEEAGYRLAGAPLDHICCPHLYGNDRMLTAWPASDHAVILTVGPHDRSAQDVYELLLAAVAVEVPDQERTKPPCCDELGEPPADAALAEALAAAVSALTAGRHGREEQENRFVYS